MKKGTKHGRIRIIGNKGRIIVGDPSENTGLEEFILDIDDFADSLSFAFLYVQNDRRSDLWIVSFVFVLIAVPFLVDSLQYDIWF